MAAAGTGPLAIIAGAGRLPAEIAAELSLRGVPFAVLPLKGVADADFSAFACYPVGMLDPNGVLEQLGRLQARAVILAGAVHRPGIGMVMAGWQAVRHREEIRRVVQGGDDNLLRGVVAFLEEHGFPVLGVRDVAPRLMAGAGPLGRHTPGPDDLADIACGHRALLAMGPSDIGQGVVVAQRRILAVEAAEGTDNMIRRVATLRRAGLVGRLQRCGRPVVSERAGGVLVKAAKPGQDFRVDLPAVGPRTVRLARRAGLSGIAVEAGAVLVVDRKATLKAADDAGLFIVGMPA
ncbi:LpxI family protein [Labrys monachus]|nr:UDP-2,3-diacylglucosamine diphosphatase LpxI [Labrys monachus]